MCDILAKKVFLKDGSWIEDDFSTSCSGLRRAMAEGGCSPRLYSRHEGFTIAGCDDSWEEPVRFCPFCGTALVLQQEEPHE